MQKKHLLVVDDDERLRNLLGEFLRQKFVVTLAANTTEALKHLKIQQIDLMILDVMMPKEDGIHFMDRIRPIYDIPTLFLSALDDKDKKIQGLNLGADDYLTKPFEPEELIARINAIFRRLLPKEEKPKVIKVGKFVFDLSREILEGGGEPITLSSTEKILLKTLCLNPKRPFSRQELVDQFPHFISERTIDVQMTRLRKKIEENPKNPIYIQTVRHVGYAFFPGAD